MQTSSTEIRPSISSAGTLAKSAPIDPAWQWLNWLGADRAIVLATLLIGIVGFAATEKIGMNRGLGWDGGVYATWVQDFPAAVEKGFSTYHVPRILPSAIAHYGLRLFKDSIGERHVIRAFGILNIICATLVAWLWCKIAKELKISDRGKWLGFAGFNLSFAITKNAFFYPVLTDVPAMAISTAMFYCYLRGWQYRLLGAIFLGAFTWPTLIYTGAILVLFPRRPELDARVGSAPLRLNLILGGLAAYYFGLWALYVIRDIQGPLFGWLTTIESVLPLSCALLVVYLLCGFMPLLNSDRLFQPARYWTRGNGAAVMGLIALVITIKFIQSELTTRPVRVEPAIYLLTIGVASVAKPAVSFVAHVIYFGPLVQLAAFLWRPVCRLIHQHGLGLTLVAAIGMAQSVDSESRHILYLIPLVFPFVVKSVDNLGWRPGQYALVVVVAALFSKTWLTINGTFQDNTYLFPDQLYTMHLGPFMGDLMYLAHLGGIGFASLLIYLVCFQQRTTAIAAAPPFATNQTRSDSPEVRSSTRTAA